MLFVIQSYPSVRSANVLCDVQILRQLRATRDYDLHILCMKHPEQPLEEEADGLVVHRVPMGWLFEQDSRARSNGDLKHRRTILYMSRLRTRARQIIHMPSYPCYDTKGARGFAVAAESLYQRYKFDLVIAEHYGFETMYAALTLKEKHPNIKYLQFFWDSLSGGFKPKYLPEAYVNRKRRALEKRVLETADASVAMTSHRDTLLRAPYGRLAHDAGHLKFLGIPYLCNVAETVRRDNPIEFVHGKKNLLFTGNLWGRNPEPLVRGLSLARRDDVVLWLVSGSDGMELSARLSNKFGIDVRSHPYVEHDQLVAALCAADVLVNFGVKNPNAISGKIIEYIGCCKPVISTYCIDNEACLPILRNYPARFLFDERNADGSGQVGRLSSFLDKAQSFNINYEIIERNYSECLPETYCSLIDELLAGESCG